MLGFGSRKSARAGVRAALLAGATIAALGLGGLGATGASASLQCTGSSITGQGSSLQKVAQQQLWDPGFNAAGVCPGGPTITYNSTGSGGGMKEWNHDGIKGFINTSLSFIGTDDPPTSAQVANIDSVADGAHVIVIPVAQTSIAVPVNLPAGCHFAEGTGITNLELQRVFRGNLKNWSGLATTEGTCNSPITRVVRKDSSGQTYQFKNYLSRMNSGPLDCVEGKNWKELRPITGPEPTPNQTWPESCGSINLSPVVRPASNGGGAVAVKVNETDGSIGYASTPDFYSNVHENSTVAALQNNGKVSAEEAFFANPESGEIANCSQTPYFVPPEARPGHSGLGVDWSEVFGAYPNIGGESYPLCTLTFVMAFHGMSLVQNPGTATELPFTEGQEITTHDFVTEYVVRSAGQNTISARYYSALPTSSVAWHNVLGAAQFDAGKISW